MSNGKNKETGLRASLYFNEFTFSKFAFYSILCLYIATATLVSFMEPFLELSCNTTEVAKKFENPAFDANPCLQLRYDMLLGLTPQECSFGRRLIAGLILGSIIGWERRQDDRPAGIRTMAVVSLASTLFTICSTFSFIVGPMDWDAARVSAAIPSGVGFLGASVIFKNEQKSLGRSFHVVNGLTTSASVWLSAAVGIACGGELYVAATFGTALTLLFLRFGPRGEDNDDDDDDKEEQERTDKFNTELTGLTDKKPRKKPIKQHSTLASSV